MKLNSWMTSATLLLALTAGAQDAQDGEPTPPPELQIAERGPHHRVWQRVTRRVSSYGRERFVTNTVVQLASGMHYQNEQGEWLESKEEIEIIQGTAVARQGQHQVIFAANLNSPGAIDMLSPDNKRFRSHVLGLAYTDYASGQSVLIAEVKDCIGAVQPPNQVIYQDAFDGDCVADVRYTYTLGGFEQDVILLTAPPSPAVYGLNPETTRLEMWTEFIELPEGSMTPTILRHESDPIARQVMAEPDLIDYRLDFGVMKFEQGQAFPLGDTDPFGGAVVPTGKSVESINGRVFLIEKVDLAEVRAHLEQLPERAAHFQRNVFDAVHDRAMLAQRLPVPKGERGTWKERQYASVDMSRKGFVLDYVTINGSLTNYVLQGDTTYYITNAVNLYGTTVIEGGVVIKGAGISIRGPLDCRTSAFRPAVWTTKHDDSIGEIAPGSTNSPSGYNGTMLNLYDTSATYDLRHFRMTYATYGIILNVGVKANLSHFQIGKSQNAIGQISTTLANCRNFLIYDVTVRAFPLNGAVTNRSEHGTFHKIGNFRQTTNSTSPFTLTNSLLIAVTNNILFEGTNNILSSSDSGFFQTASAGSYYLVDGSTNRNAGTANIQPELLAALQTSTTYAPAIISNAITVTTNLTLQVQRDTDTPDLGYHYDPLDFILRNVLVDESTTVVLTNGVIVGLEFSGTNYALRLDYGAKLISQGRADNLNRLVRLHAVQEQFATSGSGYTMLADTYGGSPQEVRLRFTDLPLMSGSHLFNPENSRGNLSALVLQDCQWSGGVGYFSSGLSNALTALTNNLFERVQLTFYHYSPNALHAWNNFHRTGQVHIISGPAGNNATFKDNFYDQTSLTNVGGSTTLTHNYNGYVTNFPRWPSPGANDVVLTNKPVYLTLSNNLGRTNYYYPTSDGMLSTLLDAGSRYATNASLAHYTVTTNQAKDTSLVDIGFHYVALDGSGQPVDTDSDGLPDYVEDINGNGTTDTGENSHINPVLTVVSAMNYIKGGPGRRFDTNAIAYDSDSPNLGGAKLTLTITSGSENGDRLGILNRGTNAGQVSISGTLISYGGTVIATNAGGTGSDPLVISFNSSAVNASLQALVRNLTFQNISNNPANSNRVVKFELFDGKGGTNSPTTQTITIVCPDAMDLMLVMDRSNSMIRNYDPNCPNETNYTTDTNRFWIAKDAASNFVASINLAGNDRVGLISFADLATLNVPLTNNGAVVQSNIHALSNTSGTMLNHPINLAKTNLMNSASNTLRVMVILSDGEIFNGSEVPPNNPDVEIEMEAARQAADENIRIITVAFYTGECPRAGGTNYLADISGSPLDYYFIDPGSLDYHYAPTFQDMASNFVAVAQSLCRNVFPPSVTITAPPNYSTNLLPTNLVVTATASDTDGTITKVEFYNFGTTKIGEDLSNPYSIVWTNPPFGTNPITARATDNSGLVSTSSTVNVIVHSPPSINIVAPTDATSFAAVMNLLVRAAAVDADGYVTNVLFYTNGTAGLNVTNPPFQFPWTNLPGTVGYDVYAIARDNHGYTNRSTTVTFNVLACSQVGVKLLTLSTNSVVGGTNLTGTITLSNAAPSGGQAVTLSTINPSVSVPTSVWIPEGQSNVTFQIETHTVLQADSADIVAKTPVSSVSTSLGLTPGPFRVPGHFGVCGPMDIAVLFDVSQSMGSSLNPVRDNILNVLDTIEIASGGDYRLALLSFQNTIYVNEVFSLTNRVSFSNQLSLLHIIDGTASEPSEEAINTVINTLSASTNRPQEGDFTTPFRDYARKIIILITDEMPQKFHDSTNTSYNGADSAHHRALEAALKGVQICALVPPSGWDPAPAFIPEVSEVADDYARVTDGAYLKVNDPEAPNPDIHLALQTILSHCGATLGEVVITRDDLGHVAFDAIRVNSGNLQAMAAMPASFDLSGLSGPVVAADLVRAGNLRVNHGGRLDFEFGVVSPTQIESYGPALTNAQLTTLAFSYLAEWALPFTYYGGIETSFGGNYALKLKDRASAACGNTLDAVDSPQADWPSSKNILNFKLLSSFEIAQGRCRDFVLTGTNAPVRDVWEIRFFNQVIASQLAPKGWDVERDHTLYHGFNICVPPTAMPSDRYEVRYEDSEGVASGTFAVLPAGTQNSAAVLGPMTFSPATGASNHQVIATVTLDAPAPMNGAVVSLTASLTNVSLPPYVQIPAGESIGYFNFTLPGVLTNTDFDVMASYNGLRKSKGRIIWEGEEAPAPPVVHALGDAYSIRITWNDITNALYYIVERSTQDCGPSNTVAIQRIHTSFIDETVIPGTNYCYTVKAVNSFGITESICWDTTDTNCATATGPLLLPAILPAGGKYNDSVSVIITNVNPGATILYNLEGRTPVLGVDTCCVFSPGYDTIVLTTNTTIAAVAYNASSTTKVVRADFLVAHPRPYSCGSNQIFSLATTNWYSPLRGDGYYVERFAIQGTNGYVARLEMLSEDFETYVYLRDAASNIVAQSSYFFGGSFLQYTFKTNGQFIVEATSAQPLATGAFSLSYECDTAPELEVQVNGVTVTNLTILDLGITPLSTSLTNIVRIRNVGTDILFVTNLAVLPSSAFSLDPSSWTLPYLNPSGYVDFDLIFNASVTGAFTGSLSFINTDEDNGDGVENPFTLYLDVFCNPSGTPPTTSVSSPTGGQTVITPGAIPITAAATAFGGASVSQVEFFTTGPTGWVKIGADGGSPYAIDWTNAVGGNRGLRTVVTDSGGRRGVSSTVNVFVNDRPVAAPDRHITLRNSGTNEVDVLSNDYDPNKDSFTLVSVTQGTNGTVSTNGAVFYAPNNNYSGYDFFTYVIEDARQARATGAVTVAVLPPLEEMPEITSVITAPTNNIEIIAPIAITGTAHTYFLHFWDLQFRRPGSAAFPWKTFAEGTDPVVDGTLGTFDPTGLPNGIYQIKLKTVDLAGAGLESSIVNIRVGESPKIGHFTLSFTDLQIPVSGLPITLTRTYDSRNTDQGDFGAGWNLDVSSVRLEKSGIMGEGWTSQIGSGLAGLTHCIQEVETHLVTITFPDDNVFQFQAVIDVNGGGDACEVSGGLGQAFAAMNFANLPGTVGTLRALTPNPAKLRVGFFDVGQPVTLHEDRDDPLTQGLFGPLYDPQEFEFTTLDGRKFQFNAAGKVVRMWDRVGNSLEFTANGIIHNNSGKRVKFVRDGAGRITEIYDPNGLTTNGLPSGSPVLRYRYDGAGDLVNVHQLTTRNSLNPAYLTTSMGYTNPKYPHYLTDITDPRNIKAVRNEYGDDGRLKSTTDANGKTINYIHSISNRTEIIVDRMGRTNTFVYDVKGNVTESVNPLGHTNRFTYDVNGNQLTHTDPLGHTTTNVFDSNDNLLSVTLPHKPGENPAAFTTRFTYDEHGNQTSITLPTGAVISNTVDTATGDLLAVRAGTNLITSFAYDANGNVTAEGDKFGTNGFAYDAFGNALFMTNTLGQVIESGYDPNGNLTNLVDGGVTSRFEYDAMNREAFSDYGNGITLSNNFDSHLDWTSVDAPTIGHMERRFDEQGRLAGWKTVNGATPGFAYNDNGQLEYETNSIGQVTRHHYDAAGRQVAVQNLTTGATSGNGFDAAGRRIAETNAFGGFTLYTYNPDGSVATMTNAFLTNGWVYNYETGGGCCGGSGATTSVTDPLGRVVTSVASPYGLPLQTITTSGANSVTNSTYYLSGMVSPDQEAEDYPIAIVDEGGRRRDFGYTGLGQLLWATDLGGTNFGGLWTNVYAADGALRAVVSPTGETNSFLYDELDNLKTNRFSDGFQLVNSYDAANRLASNNLPSGAVVQYRYDEAGRLTNRFSSLGETAGFVYNGNDAITTMTDNTGGTTNLFDSAGQLSGIDYPTGGSVRYYRDLLGRMTNITVKASGGGSSYTTKYWYDAVGNLTNVVDPLSGTTRFEYDRVNRRTKRVLPNGVTTEWHYDWLDRVTNLTHKTSGGTTLASAGYLRAAGGEPTRITREDGTYVELKYDAALRLTNEVFFSSGGVAQSTNGYVYDKAGNRVRFVSGGTTLTNAVQKGYRITQVKNGATVTDNYAYDNGGRVTWMSNAVRVLSLGYNSADQLTAITNGAAWTNYVYDASGRRVRAEDAGGQRRFLVAPSPDSDLESIHLVADSGNNLKQGYVYVGDEPLFRFNASGNPVYYLEDAMGSVIGLVSNGTAIATFKYDGFGQVKGLTGNGTNAPAGTGGDFRFHGAWLETTTDLYHMRAREYDQRVGRFLSRDPAGGDFKAPETLSPYQFALNNTSIARDPSGQFSVLEVNIAGVMQGGMQAFRAAAVNYAKRKAKEGIADAASQAIGNQIMNLIGGSWGDQLKELVNNAGEFADGLAAGNAFGRLGGMLMCKALDAAGVDESIKEKIHRGVRVSSAWTSTAIYPGMPLTNGKNCNGKNTPNKTRWSVGVPYGVPDFIIGEKPIGGEILEKAHFNEAFTVGDFKWSLKALHDDYATKNPRKPNQWKAITGYAQNHTYSRTALFIVGHNMNGIPGGVTSSKEKRTILAMMANSLITQGVIPLVVILVD